MCFCGGVKKLLVTSVFTNVGEDISELWCCVAAKHTTLHDIQRKKENEDKRVLNITYQPPLAQLKVIMSRIHLLLRPHNEHNKMFTDIPIRVSKSQKFKIPLWGQKYLKLKTKVSAALV